MKVLNQDFQEEQTALSSLHAEIINKIEGQKKKISQGNRMMQGIRDIEDHDAWMIASDGVEMRKKAEHEIAALNQLRKAPYEARFDLAIEEKRRQKNILFTLEGSIMSVMMEGLLSTGQTTARHKRECC